MGFRELPGGKHTKVFRGWYTQRECGISTALPYILPYVSLHLYLYYTLPNKPISVNIINWFCGPS